MLASTGQNLTYTFAYFLGGSPIAALNLGLPDCPKYMVELPSLKDLQHGREAPRLLRLQNSMWDCYVPDPPCLGDLRCVTLWASSLECFSD